MKPLASFNSECSRWSDDYLLEQFVLGPEAYAAPEYFEIIRGEVARRGLSTPPPTIDSLPAPGLGTRSYVDRLWRGEIPLAITYWAWGVGGNGVLTSIAHWAQSDFDVAFFVRIISLIYYVFTVAAIWRSAARYTGRRLWGDLARGSVALGLFRTVGALFGLWA